MDIVKNILLTGGSGYLGRNLTKFLNQNDYNVILLVRSNSDLTYLDGMKTNITIYRLGGVTIDQIFKENIIDIVIHTAASYGRKGEDLSKIVDANLKFPLEVLDAAISNGVKYFINTDTALPKDLNAYARSKKQFLEWLSASSGDISIINLQLEYFYGPNDDSTKFITYVLQGLRSGKSSLDFTAATPLRDFIYIDDVVDAYYTVLQNIEKFDGLTTFEIGSGEAVQLRDLIIEIRDISQNKDVQLNFGAIPMRPNEIMESCADITKLIAIGWQPKYTFRQGILKTIELENNSYGND
ncbi:NAD(P)-dependent oxidoreductase [Agrobacterium tumefaciens]|nr:NAD(P)-dependent oxidoreductase [Agrobacterium tumefaciens]NTE21955.1 NAD(P)-dependent oxidoreductase [Agrobacterium tumefaciens]